MKIATLRYEDTNLGNDIQSLAAERLLPRVDLRINYDRLSEARDAGPIALLCNGYFGSHRTPEWPLPPNVRALFVGFHASDARIVEGLKGRSSHPIGCRDVHTLELCRKAGLRAYLSGCLSLTLDRFDFQTDDRHTQTVVADLLPSPSNEIPADVLKHVRFLTHQTKSDSFPVRRQKTCELLAAYAAARWVITSRLHVVLPCAALGTPVVLVRPNDPDAARRFFGYEHLAWSIGDAPWDCPAPRVPPELIRSTTAAARLAVAQFAALAERAA